MQKIHLDDTIAAISTAMGAGGIGIVRLSGKKAIAIADTIFIAKNKKKPSEFKSYTLHYGTVVKKLAQRKSSKSKENGQYEIVDEALLVVMRAPKSYTREDMVEVSCHGSMISLKSILNLALACGARLAEPGEFTKRAFLNGRIDLAQAEAVLDIINSKTDAFLRVSMNQLKGELTIELEAIREILTSFYVEIEAIVNFPEDDINASGREVLLKKLASAEKRVFKLLGTSDQGKVLKEGIRIVLCGKPNVGKSSLLNCLLRQPRAIVTHIAGTTRDTIEETAQIRGIPFQLVDTAGILEPRDLIEKEAIKRSRMYIANADLILFVFDCSRSLNKEDEALIKKIKGRNVIVTINKCDLKANVTEKKIKEVFKDEKVLKVSALKKTGIEELEEEIVQNISNGKIVDTGAVLLSNVRHITALKNCQENLKMAENNLKKNLPLELISEEIKSAVNFLDQITGRNVDADLVDRIFSEFCIGK